LRRRVPAIRVAGFDRPAVLRRAQVRRAIHEGSPSLGRVVRDADLVILALPVERILAVLPRVARLAPSAAVLTDVAGVKAIVVRAARRAGVGARFVGGHPMAGSERAGIGAASATLFDKAPWFLCPARAGVEGRRAAARVERLVRRLGAVPVRVADRTHDRSVARLSHLPQLLAVALVNAAGHGGRALAGTCGPAFAAMSRVALSPPGVWTGVLRGNRREIVPAIDACVRELNRLRGALDGRAAPLFRRAARTRRRLLDQGGAV
jgi:prephenate dehydrogenase